MISSKATILIIKYLLHYRFTMLVQRYIKSHHDNFGLSLETGDSVVLGIQNVQGLHSIGCAKLAYSGKNQPCFFYFGSQSQNVNSSIFSRDHQTRKHGSAFNFSGLQVVVIIRGIILQHTIDIDDYIDSYHLM